MRSAFLILLSFFLLMYSCREANKQGKSSMELTSKPYCRYWWFASEIKKEDIRFNLDWLKENGFGGAEIAWVYPLNRMDKNDTSYTPRQGWLSQEWQEIVGFAGHYADSIGLACDLTMGTLWPFGDSKVHNDQATRKWGDTSWRQEITASWEYPLKGYVIDHLSPAHYLPYLVRIIDAYPEPGTNYPLSGFIDSWEVETRRLWSESFASDFFDRFGYDIQPYMDSLYQQGYESYLYDYMSLLSQKVIRFYADYDSVLNAHGLFSRGQCSGAPCDIISAYAALDIPEGEALLYEPEFNVIPSSAAALSGKKVVSAETFTCLYGWPRDYIREEQTADLKLLADALFANGINHIVWHGKPHNPADYDTVSFYASVHVGKDGALADEIPAFNAYLEKVSSYMKKGKTYADVAAYLPTEDAWIRGEMPLNMQYKWAWGHYEMRYFTLQHLEGYRPLWINADFILDSYVHHGKLICGDIEFNALDVSSEYLGYEVLAKILEIAEQGIPVRMERTPKEPGTIKHPRYDELIRQLGEMETAWKVSMASAEPLVEGIMIPPFWCRQDGDELYIFFAHPDAGNISFPMEYGQSLSQDTLSLFVEINYMGNKLPLDLEFGPYQSLLYHIKGAAAEKVDIGFVPKTPEVIPRPEGYKTPWLVVEKGGNIVPEEDSSGHKVLFKSGAGGISCYRIPALATATNGDLLVAADQRIPSCTDLRDNENINIVLRRSSDNGLSWTETEIIVDHPNGSSASDPSIIVDNISGDIFLFYNYMDLQKEKGIYYFHVIKSSDNGVSWGEPVDITDQISKEEWHKDFKFITSGRGFQTDDGMLLHCMVNLNHGIQLFGSDDHGQSWSIIGNPVWPADESKFVELADGRWMINSRVNGAGLRYVHISEDNGLTWISTADSSLSDPGCNASIMPYVANMKGEMKPMLVFANADDHKERINMTIKFSDDQGNSWSGGKMIYTGSSAYASLSLLKNGDIGLVFEKDDYGKIVFASFPPGSIIKGR